MVPWRYVILLVLAAAIVGGIAGGLVARRSYDSPGSADVRGTIVRFGSREALSSYLPDEPFCVDSQHFCLVQTADGDLLALYTYDPSQRLRDRGCDVRWLPDFHFVDPETREDKQGWFRGGCSGSTFTMAGRRVFGPAPRDLDQFPLRIVNKDSDSEYIEVDTRKLICGSRPDDLNEPCQRAPRPE